MENTHLDPSRAAPPQPPSGPPPKLPAGQPSGADPVPELRTLGEFRILRWLGEGGMGAVYLAYDGQRDRQVALKVLNDQLAATQGYVDRFYREARSGERLNHPNIVRTYSAALDPATGKYYLVLEYVDGPSAQALLTHEGKLAVGDAVHIALNIARGLEHAHSRSIVHRDIKPDNILITRSGVAKLGDLGLAKRTDEASHLTQARQGFGTTAYMPYEQAINAKYADGRSDIYALGATLYHLLTGQVPFPGDNHLEVVEKKNKGYFRPPSALAADVPPGLDAILTRMLARQPRDRYQTASEVIVDLERSRLATGVPSFADPDLARKDPWLQACLGGGEPTRLDPNGTQPPRRDDEPTPEWIVRYRNRSGRQFTSRLSADEILERLHERTLPSDASVRRPSEEAFRPLAELAEFRDHLPAAEEPAPRSLEPPVGVKFWTCVQLGGVAMLVLGLVAALARWWWRS